MTQSLRARMVVNLAIGCGVLGYTITSPDLAGVLRYPLMTVGLCLTLCALLMIPRARLRSAVDPVTLQQLCDQLARHERPGVLTAVDGDGDRVMVYLPSEQTAMVYVTFSPWFAQCPDGKGFHYQYLVILVDKWRAVGMTMLHHHRGDDNPFAALRTGHFRRALRLLSGGRGLSSGQGEELLTILQQVQEVPPLPDPSTPPTM